MKKAVLLVAALITATSGLCLATVMERMDIPWLTKESTGCVVGTVSEVRGAWNEDHTKIFTYTKIKVNRDIIAEERKRLGTSASDNVRSVGKEITLKELGGAAEGAASYVAGTPKFSKAETVAVFVAPYPDDTSHYRTIGMAQGKYTVRKNGEIEKNVAGIAFYDEDKDKIEEDPTPLHKSTLGELEREIAEALRKEKVKPPEATNPEE